MRFVTVVLGFAVMALGGLWLFRTEVLPRLHPPPPLPQLWQVPAFQLTERSGHPVTQADLAGKVWVADLFYTTCPGPCPLLSQRLADVQRAVGDVPDFRLVSVTSDPETDTPAVLSAYAQRFGAQEHWLFLTGPKEELYRFANTALKLGVDFDPTHPREPITHGTKLVLVDRAGWVRGLYDGVGGDTRNLLRDLRRLESEP